MPVHGGFWISSLSGTWCGAESWAREHRAFIDDSELFVEESAVAATAAAEAAADRLAHELRREAVGEELEAMRAQRQAMWEAGAEERAAKVQSNSRGPGSDKAGGGGSTGQHSCLLTLRAGQRSRLNPACGAALLSLDPARRPLNRTLEPSAAPYVRPCSSPCPCPTDAAHTAYSFLPLPTSLILFFLLPTTLLLLPLADIAVFTLLLPNVPPTLHPPTLPATQHDCY
eukprot:366399-Chlamydomonas_euryale.AAC.10